MFEDFVAEEETDETQKKPEKSPTDSDWTDHVLSLLEPEELVDGHVSVAGLRRVTEHIYGEIVESQTTIVSPPDSNYKNCVAVHKLAVVKYSNQRVVQVSAAVDVTAQNTPSPFNKFLTATADSRAEAKALRRLLKLNIITAEELGQEEDVDLKATIAPEQIVAISKLCERNDLDVLKVMAKFGKYKSIDELPKATARNILKLLTEYQNDSKVLPKSYQGFKKDWRK